MGIFGKIKNILFEEEEDIEETIPVFTKDDKKDDKKENVKKHVEVIDEEPPIKVSNSSKFRNVKRDIDLSFDEKDVLDEVDENISIPKVNEEMELPKKKEEQKSVFQSFDVDEFERLNAKINKNEDRSRHNNNDLKNNHYEGMNKSRKINNSSLTSSNNRDNLKRNFNFTSSGNTFDPGRKPFVPSPVISPVYGILDKNYKKSDIVDKSPSDKTFTRDEDDFDLDVVRKKAFGAIDKALEDTTVKENDEDIHLFEETTKIEDPIIDTTTKEESEVVIDDIEIEDPIDEVVEEENLTEQETVAEKEEIKEEKKSNRTAKVLEDMEKTSTLQILDDIEKELNAIKPIAKDDSNEDDENSDTLETDLFNLIDSMYEEGDGDDD